MERKVSSLPGNLQARLLLTMALEQCTVPSEARCRRVLSYNRFQGHRPFTYEIYQ